MAVSSRSRCCRRYRSKKMKSSTLRRPETFCAMITSNIWANKIPCSSNHSNNRSSSLNSTSTINLDRWCRTLLSSNNPVVRNQDTVSLSQTTVSKAAIPVNNNRILTGSHKDSPNSSSRGDRLRLFSSPGNNLVDSPVDNLVHHPDSGANQCSHSSSSNNSTAMDNSRRSQSEKRRRK